ncbi:MAG: endospore germination permease [Clostridiales bacterium]|jgi:spore germination protein KB|nr:endospore germination permease [Clostridiales bacterium]
MKLEKGVISNTQLMYFMLCFLQCMVMTVNFNYSITEHDTWIAVLVAYAITILIVLVYTQISQRLSGKNLVQINDVVFGPYLGKVISVLYIWFFLQLIINYSYFFNSFWVNFIMPETPHSVFIILLFLISMMAVRSGIEVIARCSFIFSIIVAAMIVGVNALKIKDMDISNFMPILSTSPKDFIQSVHVMLTIPFCDMVAFLMIFPYTSDNKKLRKPALIALTMSTLLLLVVVLGNIAVAGLRLTNSTSASFAATREIDIANVLTRLDVLIAISLLITVFMKITVFFYAIVLGIAQILKLRSYQPIVAPVGALAVAVTLNLYPSAMEQAYAARFVWPFNGTIFEFFLPIITLIIIAIRKLPKKRGIYE